MTGKTMSDDLEAAEFQTIYVDESAFQQILKVHERKPNFLPEGPLRRLASAALKAGE